MKKGRDIVAEFPGLLVIHQKIPGHEVGRHEHAEHEFFLPLQGEISVSFGGKTVTCGPGRMLYVPPDLDHSFTSSAQGSGERLIWLVNAKLWKEHGGGKFAPSAFAVNTLAKELLFYLLIHREVAGAKYFIAALVASLAESLRAAQLSSKGLASEHLAGRVADARVARSMEFIESNLANVKMAEVARKSGFSLRNFNRLFLKETGLSPKEFLILRRVEKAKALLKNSRTTVTDISLEVGYSSISKFIATFKKITGMLPSDFRVG